MLKKISNILFSNRLTGFLFIAFAIAMAIGTFLDAGQETSPTPYSRNIIYNTWWFESIMFLFVVNFIGNIFRYRLLSKKKWATLVLHLSWIFILVGAFITRYIGYEGVMSIREGNVENTFISQKTYLTLYVDGDYEINGQIVRRVIEEEVDFSPRLNNNFKLKSDYNKIPISIELTDFIKGAEEDVVFDENGENYLKIVESTGGMPHNHFLKEGTVQSLHNTLYTLNNYVEGAINISFDDSGIYIESPYDADYMVMATMESGKLNKNQKEPLRLRSRYIINNQSIVFPKPVVKGVFDVVKKSDILKSDQDAISLKISTPNEIKLVKVLGGQGTNNQFKKVEIGGLDFLFKYGSKVYELPFSIKLNDFIAEKYPGTEKSYSAFASEVTVIDENSFDYRIFMNNILNYKGYRFFQASFDPDEKGTILSVNYDFWGTAITYLGYILLYIGLFSILFSGFTRFNYLKNQIQQLKIRKSNLISIVFFIFSFSINAQQANPHNSNQTNINKIDSILYANAVPKNEAEKFGKIVIQDLGGRMMPVNTYASELLRKLSKSDAYKDLDANQALLSMYESPLLWYNIPIIYLKKKKGDSIRNIIGVNKEDKHIALVDFFTEMGEYKLAPYLEEAYRTTIPNAFQKEFKEIDQRVNLLYNALEGSSLRIFPIIDDENNRWISPSENRTKANVIKDTLYYNFINTGFKTYLYFLNEGKRTKNFKESDKILNAIFDTQNKYGSDVMLSVNKINSEVLYNKYDIFRSLFSWYLYSGFLLFVVLIFQIFNYNNNILNLLKVAFKYSIYLLFILHAAGLAWRWYISGHAPWSDGYETMIYIAWVTIFFGIIFGRKSDLTIASTAFVSSMILMVAHWNWMDPAIANLVPVLDSYWLMIHVSIIVGSYGPFTLSMILGLVTLILILLVNNKNKEIMALNIRELIIINEMSLTIGLVMLTIGNFLGGMWANESWGRYWGWDPKETWALISIMIYAFVLHMRLIPALKSQFAFIIASIVSYATILMTYFGVNFYLAGLHSYAKDDQQISILYSGITLFIVCFLAILAYPKYSKYLKNNRKFNLDQL